MQRSSIKKVLAGALVLFPLVSFAVTTTLEANLNDIAERLNVLENTVDTISTASTASSATNDGRTIVSATTTTSTTGNDIVELSRSLGHGAKGSDVKALQDTLGEVAGVYPQGLVTGYYGDLTESAVKRFQKAFGLPTTGYVGDLTRGQITDLTKLPARISVDAGGNEDTVSALIVSYGGRVISINPSTGLLVAQVPRSMRAEILAKLQTTFGVTFAERDAIALPEWGTTPPNDPNYRNEWHIKKIGDDQAQAITTGKGVSVAICDSGVDATHPDLSPNLTPGWNTVDDNTNTAPIYVHGTEVAGVVGAVANNGIGVAGVASGVTIVPVRVTDMANGSAYSSDIAACFTWAADHGIRVANASFGYIGGYSSVRTAAKYMFNKNGVVVIAEGNTGANSGLPDVPEILAVSATDPNDTRTGWSTYGSDVDLSAPGAGIWSTTVGGGYDAVSGTSFSSPIVAGVAALMIAKNPSLTSSQIYSILKSTSVDLGTAGYDIYYGAGRVNALAAVRAAGGITVPVPDTTAPTSPTGLTTTALAYNSIVIKWNVSTDAVGVAGYHVYRNNIRIATTAVPSFTNTALAPTTSYTYAVSAFDAAGNESAVSAAIAVVTPAAPDTTAPTASFYSPVSGATVSGTVGVLISANDNVAIGNVILNVNGTFAGIRNSAPYSFVWDSTKTPNGTTTLLAYVYDTAGNQTLVSIPVTVYNALIDTTAPSIPTGLATTTVSSTSVGLKWNPSTDNVGVAGYHVYRNGVRIATTTANGQVSSLSYTDVNAVAGSLSVYAVSAFDAMGNESGRSALFIITPTIVPTTPAVAFATPRSGAVVSGSVPVTISANDPNGVRSVWLIINGSLAGIRNSYPYSFVWDTTKVPNGRMQLYTYVASNSGTYTFTSISVIVQNSTTSSTGDVTPPTPPWNALLVGFTSTSASLSWSASADKVGVKGYYIYRDGERVATVTTTTYTDTTLAPRTWHLYNISAFDAAGNESAKSPSVGVITKPIPSATVNPVTITNLTTSPQYAGNTLMYRAKVTSTNGLRGVYLYKDIVNGLFSTRLTMIPSSSQADTYEIAVPAQTATTFSPYAIYAVDGTGATVASATYSLTIANATSVSAPTGSLAADAASVDLGPLLSHFVSAVGYLERKLQEIAR
ncbi:MAG: S8 family serine peptidase [Minisyncoccota bacterium]